MKKLIVIALAVVMMVSAVAVLAACGKTYEGEYSYVSPYNAAQKYGCKVKVTVKGDTITNVEVVADTEDFFNLTSSWNDKSKWEQGGQGMIDSFVGLTIDEVNKIVVKCDTETNSETHATKGQPQANGISNIPTGLKVVTGATQSSGRLILAVQNALKNVK